MATVVIATVIPTFNWSNTFAAVDQSDFDSPIYAETQARLLFRLTNKISLTCSIIYIGAVFA